MTMDEQPPPDPYKALGVSRDADAATIKKTYRKLVLLTHPDKVTDENLKKDAADRFHGIQQAYETLADDEKRKRYDAEARLYELKQELAARGGSSRTDAKSSASVYGGGPTGTTYTTRGPTRYEERRPRTYEPEERYESRPNVTRYNIRPEDYANAKRSGSRATRPEPATRVSSKDTEKVRAEQRKTREKEDRRTRDRGYKSSSEEEARERYEEAYRRREAEARMAEEKHQKQTPKYPSPQRTPVYEHQTATAREYMDRSRAFDSMRGGTQRTPSTGPNARYQSVRHSSTKPAKEPTSSRRTKASSSEKPPLHESHSSPAGIKIPSSSRKEPHRSHTTSHEETQRPTPIRRADTMPVPAQSAHPSRKTASHTKDRGSDPSVTPPVDSGYSSPSSDQTATPTYPSVPHAVPAQPSSKTQRYQYTPGAGLQEHVAASGPYRTVLRTPDERPSGSPEPMPNSSRRASPEHFSEVPRDRERERERAAPMPSSRAAPQTTTRGPHYETYDTPKRPDLERRKASDRVDRRHAEYPYAHDRQREREREREGRGRDREPRATRFYGEIPSYEPSSRTHVKSSTPRKGGVDIAGVAFSPSYNLDDVRFSTGHSRPTLNRGQTFAGYGLDDREMYTTSVR